MSSFFNMFKSPKAGVTSPSCICSVCLLPVNIGAEAFTDPSGCGHLLHLPCFMQAHGNMHSSCPTCRAPFSVAPPIAPVQAPMQMQNTVRSVPTKRSYNSSAVAVPPEELLVFVAPVVAEAGTVQGDAVSAPPIELIVTPEVPSVVAGSEQRMFINISTVSHEFPTAEKTRVGVDLVAILDKSGSMSGEKNNLLRDALRFVIDELGDSDRLSTITFDSAARFSHGLTRMTATGKSVAHTYASSIGASGGTNIYDGLRHGVAALEARKVPNAVSTVFLLTDGIDDSNLEEKLAIARKIRSNGWFLFVFAFGRDHNARHLNAIAEAADSSYIFIENLSTVREAFGGAIGSQQGVAGKILTLSLQARDEGVVFHRAISGQYSTSVTAFGRVATVSYPNLLVGERRDCCLELTIPAVAVAVEKSEIPVVDSKESADDTEKRTVVLIATLTYTPVSSSGTCPEIAISSEPCILTRPDIIAVPLARDPTVDIQINRIMAVEAMEQATLLADSGKLDEARELISNTKQNLTTSVSAAMPHTAAMITEQAECLDRLHSSREWDLRGRSAQTESANVYKTQRGVYAKKKESSYGEYNSPAMLFSNACSKVTQTKAMNK